MTNGITLVDKKNDLEISFSFNFDEEFVIFEKMKFINFVESYLNAHGLGKDMPSNKLLRSQELESFFNGLIQSDTIEVENKSFKVRKENI